MLDLFLVLGCYNQLKPEPPQIPLSSGQNCFHQNQPAMGYPVRGGWICPQKKHPNYFLLALRRPEQVPGSGRGLLHLCLCSMECGFTPTPPHAYRATPVPLPFPGCSMESDVRSDISTCPQFFIRGWSSGIQPGSIEGLSPRGAASYFSYFKEPASEQNLHPPQNTKDSKQKSKNNPVFDASVNFYFS